MMRLFKPLAALAVLMLLPASPASAQTKEVELGTIDIPEMAQRNLSSMLETDGRGIAMLSFGEDGGLLTVSCRGELYLSRRIDVSSASASAWPGTCVGRPSASTTARYRATVAGSTRSSAPASAPAYTSPTATASPCSSS